MAPKAHVLVLPMPCQGHVTPLMELSHLLVDQGFEVTFVNTDVDRAAVVAALEASGGGGGVAALGGGIHLTSIPDGLADDEDRKDISKLVDAYTRHMPGYLERLLADMEAAGRPRAKWLVADTNMGWSFEVAKKLGIRVVSFWPAATACLAFMLKIPKLIQDGLLDDKGLPVRQETFQLAPGMPPLHSSQLSWNNAGEPEGQHIIFELVTRNNKLNDELAEMVVSNSFYEAEAGAFKLFPGILPIGPLSADGAFRKPVGHYLPEDERCVKWLDAHPDASSVVKAWLHEFQRRVAGRGMIVSWCSQQQVLAHRAVACFVSHCGWNSTMEGLRNGVPFLCWPYFCDQYLNRSYIVNVWKTGLAVTPDADGIVGREELRSKVEQVVGDADIKDRARVLKDEAHRCVAEGGSSNYNFKKLVNLLSE
ncbi:UDP-glycosyltransferase 83A1 [Zea mays]|uniref:UDP-glycosyltransferase 83A1 n=1 Tax=Zea mays TaxID=4577 RepID=A0A317YKG6_MAIZE|nr:UDP-glycosyltransferase 83A1 [Zea mays]